MHRLLNSIARRAPALHHHHLLLHRAAAAPPHSLLAARRLATMSLPRVPILDFVTNPDVEQEALRGVADVVCLNISNIETDLPDWVQECRTFLVWHHFTGTVSRGILTKHFPNVKTIVRVGAGFDNVDIRAAGELGIAVVNIPDYGTHEVADSAVSLMLNIARKTHVLANAVAAGEWPRTDAMQGAFRLAGKKCGIIGLGRIGTCFAMRAKAFGLDVHFYDPYIADGVDKALGVTRHESLEELLAECDIISIHCLLTPETRHIINRDTIRHMKRGAVIVNTARGPCVEEGALVEALKSGHLVGAGLDVLEREPCTDRHLADVPNLIITPHSAFYSDESWVEMRHKAALEAKRALEGKPPRNPVNTRFMAAPAAAAASQ